MWLGQLCLNAVEQGQKVLIASFEMNPKQTLGRMMKQAGGSSEPPKDYRQKLMEWMGANLWLYVDNITPKPR